MGQDWLPLKLKKNSNGPDPLFWLNEDNDFLKIADFWQKMQNMHWNLSQPWLVDWLRVPTPMRAIRVRAWVEVVGSVMELFHFRVQWNARNISRATLRECGEASSFQEANLMYEETNHSCLPARSCQEANLMYEETDDSLSEGELESTWPFGPVVYKNIAEFNEIKNSSPYNGEDGAD